MFFDSSLHLEAWSKIYQELHPEDTNPLGASRVCGANNDAILRSFAPWLSREERDRWSEHKEDLYRRTCKADPEKLRLTAGTEAFLQYLKEQGIPFALASASIRSNIQFYFDTFSLGRWFKLEDIVFDDGSYPDKGAMHLEAARRLQVDISDCLLVEDSPSAIRHAKEIGAGCIVAIGETADPAELKRLGADHYIRDFTEFDLRWFTS